MASSVSSINSDNPDNISVVDAVIKDAQSQIISSIQGMYEQGRNISTTNEIQYIPIIFSILYNPDQDNSIVTEEVKDEIFEKATWLIDNINSVFAGTNSNSAYAGNGNWQTILQNVDHAVTSKVRFFLPHKIPKEYLYPFYPSNISGPSLHSVDFSSLEAFNNSFGFGLSNIPTMSGYTYTSNFSYEEIRDQRILVKQLYAESLIDNSPGETNTNSANERSLAQDYQTNKEYLELMEDNYFFFFGSRPGLIFVRRFNDDTGFGINSRDSYQMNAIRNIEHGSTPTYHSLRDFSPCGKLYEQAAPQAGTNYTPSGGLFSNLPFLKITSTVKSGAYNNPFLE